MLGLTAYLLVILGEFIFAVFFCIYTLLLIYSSLMGSPYVPTRNQEIDLILSQANLKKNLLFLELGCGDGRVVRQAVKKYGVRGLGVDINPLLIAVARLKSKWEKLKNIEFRTQNLLDADVSNAKAVYLFLMPKLIKKIAPRLLSKLPSGAQVISHGFIIEDWDRYLVKKINRRPFPTYYYQLG